MRKAFTMIELVFVIVVVGILAGIAIPKFAATRDDAIISKARATVGAVRSALATERQKRIMRGEFNTTVSTGSEVFALRLPVSGGGTEEIKLLEYKVKECSSGSGCWERVDATTFKFYGPGGTHCTFDLNTTKFTFNPDQTDCDIPNLKNM